MARPKKEKAIAPAAEKTIQLSSASFYSMQNSVAHALSVYHQMATNAMQATSQQLGAINAAMLQVQQATTKHMTENSIDPETADLSAYGPLMRVLSLDRNLIGNPLGDPLGVDPQPVVVAPKVPEAKLKKERKPRKPKDPNAPKRPLTGYLMYYTESKSAIEDKLKATIPDVSKGRVQEEGKNLWNNMSVKEKETWKERYKVAWEKYQESVKDYLAKGGAVDPDALVAPDVNGADEDEDDVATVAAAEESSDDSSSDDSDSDDEDEAPAKVPTPPPAKKAAKGKKAAETTAAAKESKPDKKKPAPKDATPKKSALKKDVPDSTTKKSDKADSPEAAKKSKKRKSTGEDADKAEKKKKRKSNSGYGFDY